MSLHKSDFEVVGKDYMLSRIKEKKVVKAKAKNIPYISMGILAIIVTLCIFAEVIMTKDPTHLNLRNISITPSSEFLFGTDTMGRDIFSMIWYGGRISLFIGVLATVISTVIAVIYGTVSACSNSYIDDLMI